MKKITEIISEVRSKRSDTRNGSRPNRNMPDNPYVCLVSTRNSDCAILLGEGLEEVMPPEQVKKVCKDLGIDYVDPGHDFDDMDENDYLPGAVIEIGERRIVWYDMLDGTVDYYEPKVGW